MSDTTETPRRSSSVLFALGQLTAEIKGYHEEQTLNRQAVEKRLDSHDKAIDQLNRWRWINAGGVGVLVVLTGWLVDVIKPFGLHVGP